MDDLRSYLKCVKIGDWFVLYQMSKNLNRKFFYDFLLELSKDDKAEDCEVKIRLTADEGHGKVKDEVQGDLKGEQGAKSSSPGDKKSSSKDSKDSLSKTMEKKPDSVEDKTKTSSKGSRSVALF